MTLLCQVSWWPEHVWAPTFFVVLGAAVGFAAGRLNDWLDARKVKKAFLKAIHLEVSTLCGHLGGTLKDAAEVRDHLRKGEREVLQLVTSFQTGVYSSQLGKLRDVSDPLVLEIIRFYDELSNLERVKNYAAARSVALTALTDSKEDMAREQSIGPDYVSSLDEVIKRLNQLIQAAGRLLAKLPQ